MTPTLVLMLALTAPPAPRVQWVVYTCETGCAPCKKFEKDCMAAYRKSGWRVGETGHINIKYMRITDPAPEGVEMYPTFILMVDGKEKSKVAGYPPMTRKAFGEMYYQAHRELK